MVTRLPHGTCRWIKINWPMQTNVSLSLGVIMSLFIHSMTEICGLFYRHYNFLSDLNTVNRNKLYKLLFLKAANQSQNTYATTSQLS